MPKGSDQGLCAQTPQSALDRKPGPLGGGQRTLEVNESENTLVGRRLMTIEQILAILRETPNRLSVLTGGAIVAHLHASPEPGEWSVAEVLAHLRSCADVWGEAIETIVVNDHPTIRAVNPTTWIETTDYRELGFGPSLRAFTRQRDRQSALLGHLRNEGWSRSATVLGAGKPLELTAHSYADRLARHERAHWRQVEKTLEALASGTPSRRSRAASASSRRRSGGDRPGPLSWRARYVPLISASTPVAHRSDRRAAGSHCRPQRMR